MLNATGAWLREKTAGQGGSGTEVGLKGFGKGRGRNSSACLCVYCPTLPCAPQEAFLFCGNAASPLQWPPILEGLLDLLVNVKEPFRSDDQWSKEDWEPLLSSGLGTLARGLAALAGSEDKVKPLGKGLFLVTKCQVLTSFGS